MEKMNIKAETNNASVLKRLWNKVVDGLAADKVKDADSLNRTEDNHNDFSQLENRAQKTFVPSGDKGIDR